MNLTGAVHVSGGGITRVLGDNATINVVAHDTESDAFFSGGASWGLNDGILVQGANASVTLDVEGRLQSNNNSFGISWNGSGGSALVDVYGSDANINVAIDNAFLSGGYVVRANGDDAVVNLSTFNADGYYSGVEVVGNRADVTYTATWNWTNDYHYPSSGGYMPSALNLVGSDATFDLNFVNYSKGAMTGSFVNVDGDTNLGSVSLIDVSLDINGYTVPWIEAQTGGASVLTVSGTDNTIDFVMQSVDISGGSAPWSDGSSPVFNMIGNANTVHVDAIDTNISNSGGAFLKINGDDNEFILDVAGVPHGTAYSYIDGANSRINGDNNTVDVNFNHHSEGYISLLMDGDDNTFNVDAHTDNTYPSGGSNLHASGSVYVGVDVSNGVGNVINITADHSAVGFDNTGWTSGGITVTGDTYDTTINIDMVNQAYVTGDIDLLSGGYFNTYNEYDTINIDSTSSLFDIKITQDGYHGAVVNVDNNMIHNYSGGATNVATFNSVLELVSNGSGGITLNMDPGAHDINTIVSGTNGYVELSASTAYQDGNDDYLFAEASNNLYVDNWEGWNDDKIILGNTSDFAYFYANDLGSGGYYDAVNSYTVSGGNAMWALQEFGWDRSLGYTGDNGGVYDYTNQDNNITAVIYGYNLDASLGSWNPEFDYGGGSEAAAWYFGAEIFVVSDEGSSLDVWQWNVYNNQWDLRLEVNIGSFDPMNYHWDSLSEILIHQNQMPATFTV
jgi:hypothetical protein